VGEFSFILGTVALILGVLSESGRHALGAASILSIALDPYIYRWARRMATPRTAGPLPAIGRGNAPIHPNRCILVGYGPVGRIVHQLLRERGARITVIDLNLDTVRRLAAEGHAALYGDVVAAIFPGTLALQGGGVLRNTRRHPAHIPAHGLSGSSARGET